MKLIPEKRVFRLKNRFKEPGNKNEDQSSITKIKQKLNDFENLQSEIYREDPELENVEGRISDYINKYSD